MFEEVEPLPEAPSVIAPKLGSVVTAPVMKLAWHSSSGAISYRWQAALDSTYQMQVIESTVPDTIVEFVPSLLGTTYHFRVCANGVTGPGSFCASVSFYVAVPKAEDVTEDRSDQERVTLCNYPNPFNPSTTIEYYLDKTGHVTMDVYDVRGASVARLVDSEQHSGLHRVTWDAGGLAAGVYFCILQRAPSHVVSRLNLIR